MTNLSHAASFHSNERIAPSNTYAAGVSQRHIRAIAARELRMAPERALARIVFAGALLIVAGLLLDPPLPINKRLWTSSFALLSSGVSVITLVCCAVGLTSDPMSRVALPLKILGGNALLAFTLSTVLGYVSGLPILRWAGEAVSSQYWGDQTALSLIPDAHLASLDCAVVVLALITMVIWPLHRPGDPISDAKRCWYEHVR